MKIIRPVEITDGATFSRASTATYFDADGVMQTAAIDEPRWGHEYVDGKWVSKGLVLEGQATNFSRMSSAPTGSHWIHQRVSSSVVAVPSPVSNDSTKLAETTETGEHYFEQQVPAGAGVYTSSAYFKAAEVSVVRFRPVHLGESGPSTSQAIFDLTDNTYTIASGGRIINARIVDAGGGWKRCSVTYEITAATTHHAFRVHIDRAGFTYTGDGVSGYYIAGVQVEQGPYPTSYIPTTTAQVTRAPDLITGTGLVATNVPENDYPEWTAGTYNQGDRRIIAAEHTVYEVVAETTTDSPLDGLAKSPPTWMVVGGTNRWKAFDDKVGTATESPEEIRYSLMPGAGVDAVAFFGVDAGGVQVIVTDPLRGEIYNSITAPVLTDGIETWWDYFFAPIELRQDFVVSGLGATKYCRIDIIITKTGGAAKVGAIVMGKLANLGLAVYGTSVGITDYSRKERDVWGNTIIVERAFSKRADFQVAVETREVGRVQRVLAQYRATPIVWIGADNSEETLVYGFYRDFDIVIANPAISDANISVEGLT